MSNQAFSKIWIIVILIMLIAGGILVWKYSEEKVKMPEEKTPEEVVTDETINWKAYQSPTMGFFMKYPPDWTTTPEGVESGGKRMTFQSPVGAELVVMRGESNYSYEKDKELTCEELVSQYETKRKEIILDNLPAFISSSIAYSEATGPNPVKITHICEESKRIEMSLIIYNYDEANENLYSPIFNKMLSTFKITGPINFSESYYNWMVFRGWRIYRNDQYRIEFKYPDAYKVLSDYTEGPKITIIISPEFNIKITFEIYDNPSFLSLTEWARNYNPSIKWRNILVNNVESLRSPSRDCGDCKNWQDLKIPEEFLDIAGEWEILIYKKDKIVKILFAGERVGMEDSTLDNMLSTFRFLE